MPKATILRRLLRRGKLRGEKEKRELTHDTNDEDQYSNVELLNGVSLDDGLGLLECHNSCEGPSDGIDLVFVHGLRGSRFKTWSKQGVFWPRDFLRDDLKKARIVSWGYDANIANAFSYASKESLFGHANTLLNDLARLRRGITRSIIFVCHSLGGLVVKEALITSDNYRNHGRHPTRGDIYAKTVGIIFMGTPHQGSPKESYGDIVANIAYLSLRQPNRQLLRTLRPDSHVLEKQRNDFTTISDKISIVCMREELPTGAGMIVPRDSAWHSSFNALLDSIHANHMDMVRFSSRDENYQKVLGYIKEIRDAYISEDHLEDDLIQDRCNEVLRALKFQTIEKREDGIDNAYAETCSWILESESKDNETNTESCQFLSWLENDKPFFWVSGKAGCGKSTLMKYMYHDERTKASLQNSAWTRAKDLKLIGHFFYDRGDDNQKSREGMLKNILHQILQSRHELIQKCYPAIFKSESLKSSMSDEISFCLDDWEFLSNMFITMLDYLEDSKICLFLDGLDEYRMVGRRRRAYTEEELDLIFDGENEDEAWGRSSWITDGHREIARFISRLGDSPGVKICLSSRELNVFEHEFRDFPRTRVHEHTTGSIIQYCQGNLTKAAPDLDGLTNFVSSIAEKSYGVFLWVRIVVDMLIDGYTEGSSEDELWQVLNSLPRRLGGDDGLYMRMMQMVKREYLPESKRLFQLVSSKTSRTNMDIITLFFSEQWHLENGEQEIRAKTEKLQPRTWDELQPRWKALEKRLKSRCGGLLEGTKEVKFMHQTAKEFISREYLKNKIFQDAVGFFPASNAYIASMSGGIRRLKCCAESIVTPDMLDVNPHINNISVNPFKDVRVRTPKFRLMDFILGHANSMASSTEIEGDACRFYIELLDELNHVSSQLIVSLKDAYNDLSFTWCDVYIENVCDLLEPLPRFKSFLQLAFLYKLTPYVEAKVKGQGFPRDELELFLLHLSRHSEITWWGDDFYLLFQPIPRIFEMLFLEGADPNCRTDPQNNETAWTCHLKCVKHLHQTETHDLWGATTRLFLKFGADPGVRVEPKHVTSGIDVGGDRDDEGSGLTVEDIIRQALAQKPQDLFETLKILDKSRKGWQND